MLHDMLAHTSFLWMRKHRTCSFVLFFFFFNLEHEYTYREYHIFIHERTDDPYRKWSMAEQQHMYFIYMCICVCIYKCTWIHVYMHTDTCVHISTQYQNILLFSKKHPASSLAENVPSLWLISAFTFDLCGLPKARSAMKGKRIKASRQVTCWFMQKKR